MTEPIALRHEYRTENGVEVVVSKVTENKIISQLADQLHGETKEIKGVNINEDSHLVFFVYMSQLYGANLTRNNKNVRKNSVRRM